MALPKKVNELNQMIKDGEILKAFDKFYSQDVVIKENEDPSRKGKEENREYQQGFINAIKQWNDAQVLSEAFNEKEGIAAIEWYLDFTLKNGKRIQRSQVAIQKWHNGKIQEERFYYTG